MYTTYIGSVNKVQFLCEVLYFLYLLTCNINSTLMSRSVYSTISPLIRMYIIVWMYTINVPKIVAQCDDIQKLLVSHHPIEKDFALLVPCSYNQIAA